jgi:hypothetical protein
VAGCTEKVEEGALVTRESRPELLDRATKARLERDTHDR